MKLTMTNIADVKRDNSQLASIERQRKNKRILRADPCANLILTPVRTR